MSARKFLIFMSLVLALMTFSWGIDQAGAQVVIGPTGFNPNVDYNVPNFAYSPNIRKFVDSLPGLGAPGCTPNFGAGTCHENNLNQYIPIAEPRTFADGSDYYEISAREYNMKMHSDLPLTHRLRGYVQTNAAHASSNAQQYLGPAIIAKTFDPTKQMGVNGNGRPVRVKFTNALPTGANGNLPLPVDTTLMGSGLGPDGVNNFTQNRVTIPHLHGGATPWISDGTPHQWLTPAGEPLTGVSPANLPLYRKGASFANVPDMIGSATGAADRSSYPPYLAPPYVTTSFPPATCIGGVGGIGPCFTPASNDGIGTLYWSNQQSARLMFYHDHAQGLTRHNVYLGLAAPYILHDQAEDDMIDGTNISGAFTTPKKVLPDLGIPEYRYGIPLVIQDKTFVNAANTPPGSGFAGVATSPTATVDPRWYSVGLNGIWPAGTTPPVGGDLWWPHEYMPNEDIYDPSGANPLGRWDYGPWLNPPSFAVFPNLPTPSITGEAFMDTMVVNGTAFPYLNVPPSAVRFRILNAADDRSLNLSWFVADPANLKEVKMVPAAPNAAYPTWPSDGRNGGVPDPTTQGPSWYHIGVDGGFMPNVSVLPPQPVAFEYSRLLPTVLNVTNQSLFLMGAMRADVIVDFSAFAGKTLILYNDAPAPMPLFDERYDLYTGDPDFRTTGGAPTTVAGFGPNTRTIMQVRVAAAPVTPFDLASLQAALPQGYAATQPRPIVPQLAYNTAFPGIATSDLYVNNTDATINLTGATQAIQNVVVQNLLLAGGGTGYVTPPTVSFFNATPGGSGAAATAFLNGVDTVTVTNGGSGYFAASVCIDPPSVGNVGVTPAAAVCGAGCVATITGGAITALTAPVTPGAGYFSGAPPVTITGTGTGATATAVVNATTGAVTGFTITNGGSGYTAATASLPAGAPVWYQATANASVSGGQVAGITITDPGAGYTVNPGVKIYSSGAGPGPGLCPAGTAPIGGTIAVATSGVTAGAVAHIQLTNGGSGYTKAPFVNLLNYPGDPGTGAAANAMLVNDTVIDTKNITEGFDPWYGRLQIMLGTTPSVLSNVTIPANVGIAQYIDPPSDIWNDGKIQVFKLTHVGVDSHSVHFHLANLQIVNRVDFTNTMLPPTPDEIGWRESVRTNPFADLVLAVKPYAMKLPFAIPRSYRLLDPTTPVGSTANFIQPGVGPGTPAPSFFTNVYTDFGWEYVWHCHLLTHEENDMMRPIVFNAVLMSPPTGVPAPNTTFGFPFWYVAAATQTPRLPVVFTAGSIVPPTGSTYFRFTLNNGTTNVIQTAYTTATTWTMNTLPGGGPIPAGSYTLTVDAASSATPAVIDATGQLAFDIVNPPATGVTLTSNLGASPQTHINGTSMSFTAAGSGSTGYLYRFNNGATVVQDWSSTATYTPSQNLVAGVYSITADVKTNPLQTTPDQTSTAFSLTVTAAKDFSSPADGKTDILLRNKISGDLAVWLMNGTTLTTGKVFSPGLALTYQTFGQGDFNNDGKTDILMRNTSNGDVIVWLMNGTTLTLGEIISPALPLIYEIDGTGDFNKDGKTDILMRNKSNGDIIVWLMNGTTLTSGQIIYPGLPLIYEIAGTGDFNNDGNTDILMRNKSNGDIIVWLMNGTTLTSGQIIYPGLDLSWDIVGTGDFNNDGNTDILLRNKVNGDLAVWLMNGTTLTSGQIIYPGLDLSWQVVNR